MEFRDQGDDFEAGINIIPLVDIMLVLLIIFMITAPVLKHAFEVQVPETENTGQREFDQNIPVITLMKNRTVKVNGVKLRNLTELYSYAKHLGKKEVLIEADRNLEYGFVVKVMDILRGAGVEKIGLITEQKNN